MLTRVAPTFEAGLCVAFCPDRLTHTHTLSLSLSNAQCTEVGYYDVGEGVAVLVYGRRARLSSTDAATRPFNRGCGHPVPNYRESWWMMRPAPEIGGSERGVARSRFSSDWMWYNCARPPTLVVHGCVLSFGLVTLKGQSPPLRFLHSETCVAARFQFTQPNPVSDPNYSTCNLTEV
jgi:hypothetical protein